MALLHTAEVRPSKLEPIRAWAPSRSWFPAGAVGELIPVAASRFDDPDGELGPGRARARATTARAPGDALVSNGATEALERREPTAVVSGSGSESSVVSNSSADEVVTHDEGEVTLIAAADVRLAMPPRDFGENFVGAVVVDQLGNVLGIMHSPHDLEVLESTPR